MKRRSGLPFPAFLACILAMGTAASCDLLLDEPLEVAAWTPGEGLQSDPASIVVSLRFSREPDKPSAERAFSLTEDGGAIQGDFLWVGPAMTFRPKVPLRAGKQYRIALSEAARDGRGVSLDKAFVGTFSTRAEGSRPALEGSLPADGEVVEDVFFQPVLRFSSPADADSCRDGVSISPSISGIWTLEDGGLAARFLPAEAWARGKRYDIAVASTFRDAAGLTTGREWTLSFSIAPGGAAPSILRACAAGEAPGGGVWEDRFELVPDDPASAGLEETAGWESAYRLRVFFSEPVDISSFRSRFSVEPSVPSTADVEAGGGSVLVRFPEGLPYRKRVSFAIAAGVKDARGNATEEAGLFRVLADGPRSRPPVLVGIRLPLAPGGATEAEREPTAFAASAPFADFPVSGGAGRYPFDVPTATWIEIYFDVAEGAAVDLHSVREKFRVEATNGCLSFSSRSVLDAGFSCAEPHPAWAGYSRVEVRGLLTNGTDSGTVSVRLGAGLADSFGNRTAEATRLPLLK